MTRIRQTAFSHRIEEYLLNAGTFDMQKFDSSLHTVVVQDSRRAAPAGNPPECGKVIRGLSFSDHIELVMLLIARAYRGLQVQADAGDFSRAIAGALQTYAAPIADGDYACFPYPYFLLHGLEKPTAAEVVLKLEENGRIIHESLAARGRFMEKFGGPTYLERETKMLMEEGAAEDTSGVCCYLAGAAEPHPHGTDCTYIAKVSFFLDTTNREIIVITVQGQRIQQGNRERSRCFARLSRELAMDPRTFILKKICEIGERERYHKLRVIRPTAHPMFLDSHEGFMARYEPVVVAAGIDLQCGCYLEKHLSAPAA